MVSGSRTETRTDHARFGHRSATLSLPEVLPKYDFEGHAAELYAAANIRLGVRLQLTPNTFAWLRQRKVVETGFEADNTVQAHEVHAQRLGGVDNPHTADMNKPLNHQGSLGREPRRNEPADSPTRHKRPSKLRKPGTIDRYE